MGFLVQKLLPTLQPGRRLVVAGSDAALHSRQGAWDGGCALHCAAMALALLGLLRDPSGLRGAADDAGAAFWDRAWPHYLHGVTLGELRGLLAELRWGLRTAVEAESHEAVARFCERELARGRPVVASWRRPDEAGCHAALAVGVEGRTHGHRFAADTLLMLDPAEPAPRLAAHNARLTHAMPDRPGRGCYVTADGRQAVLLDGALSIGAPPA